jgi:hypothetical protein
MELEAERLATIFRIRVVHLFYFPGRLYGVGIKIIISKSGGLAPLNTG